MIESKDVSVIVQGAINEYTESCLISLRNTFPHAQIILSTWEDSNVSGFEYDEVVFSKDPGGVISDDVSGTVNNINRQIVSTKSGLALAKRRHYLKTRTDIVWKDDKILNYFGAFDEKSKSLHFKKRLLICNYYTRNPNVISVPFHTSDWITFGLAEDVNLLYDIELQCKDELRWFKNHERENREFYTNLLVRYVPEQYICLNFLKKFYRINCSCFYDASRENIRLTEEVLANDFVVLDYKKQLNIVFPKYNPNKYFERFTLVSHKYWKVLYSEHCLGNSYFKISRRLIRDKFFFLIFKFRRMVLVILHKMRIKEKIKKILTKIKS